VLQFKTIYGELDVELYDQDKPVTVRNFLRYLTNSDFNDNFFYRCQPGFVLQGGGIYNPYPLDTHPFTNYLTVTPFPNISNEAWSGVHYSNNFGTIAMATASGNPNSASQAFFFNLANNGGPPNYLDAPTNNGGYTVFGHIISANSTNVLNWINANLYYGGYGIVDLGGALSTCPVNYFGDVAPNNNQLSYFTISLLKARVTTTNNTRVISWNTLYGLTNFVEYATNLPPKWQTLTNLIGTGFQTNVVDSSTNKPGRFYRIRISH